ncbi:CLUMA_CG005132, isoform A [Clunio marinus]|uniref:CLUMA_CG005132, isoform A n=1 Tax=Clunio marinus TaxID=568069 RepID=A0A1J1HZB2_9DIPT|nr:CLUMA_CG005132, isoform A [Clunio marinus]
MNNSSGNCCKVKLCMRIYEFMFYVQFSQVQNQFSIHMYLVTYYWFEVVNNHNYNMIYLLAIFIIQ